MLRFAPTPGDHVRVSRFNYRLSNVLTGLLPDLSRDRRRGVTSLRALTAIGLVVGLLVTGCGVRPSDPSTGGNGGATPGAAATTSAPDPGGAKVAPANSKGKKAPSAPATSSKPKPPPPPKMLLNSIIPTGGTTVGIAMPIIVVFTDSVKESARKGIEKAMKLSASTPVTGAWHWFGDRQVEFRPRQYWPAGDRVTLDAEFKGVPDGYGRVGTHSYVHHFTIGSDFETKISVPNHTTKVYHDGKLIRTMASDAGSPDFPSWDGTMAVSEKDPDEHMTSCSAGITCNKKSPNWYDGFYPWAVRLTWSGTFVHYSNADPAPGHSFGSHGCIHLSLTDAKWYYDHVNIGDPVTISGSPRGKAAGDNGYAVYNLSWHDWVAESGMGTLRTAQA